MIEAIPPHIDPLDPSATEWTPRRNATDPPPRTYVPVTDCLPHDPTNGNRHRRRRTTNTTPHHGAATHNNTSIAVVPPKPINPTHLSPPNIVEPDTTLAPPHIVTNPSLITVQQTRTSPPFVVETPQHVEDWLDPSPPSNVEPVTMHTAIVNKLHHPLTICIPQPASHYLLSSPSSVEQAFPMLPPINVEIIATTTYTTVENASTSPPLPYIYAHHTNTLSANLTVYSLLTYASRSRC